jgi:hypothetical protein
MDSSSPPGFCGHCGFYAYHYGVCPRIKAIEYHPDGNVKRVEYHEPRPMSPTFATLGMAGGKE